MHEIVAEFHYWDYGDYSRAAMESRPEITMGALDTIAKEFNVTIHMERDRISYFHPLRLSWRLPRYSRIVIQVRGKRVDDVRSGVGQIFLQYGQPDEVPAARFGEKKEGQQIIDKLLSTHHLRKRD